MNRKRKADQLRKALIKISTDFKEVSLNRDDDGTLLPKKHRGYNVRVTINGYRLYCPDKNRYEAYKAAYDAAKWLMTEPLFDEKEAGLASKT